MAASETAKGSLDGKLALITGASRGIGAAIARNLAAKGASLILNYTSESSTKKAEVLAEELEKAHGIKAFIVRADMGDRAGPASIVEAAKKHFSHPETGHFQVDIVINNAGVADDRLLPDVDFETFTRMYSINVLGPILLMQAVLPYLPTDRSGRVVNVSSVSSSCGFIGQTIYGGTKAALEAMTRTWARELSERATVNSINPGPVATDMYGNAVEEFLEYVKPFILHAPLQRARKGIDDEAVVQYAERYGGRSAYAFEIAGIVAMLCTTDSAWCTGSVICANGGMRMSE